MFRHIDRHAETYCSTSYIKNQVIIRHICYYKAMKTFMLFYTYSGISRPHTSKNNSHFANMS